MNKNTKVYDYIKKFHMIQKDDKIIAGISGGPDSVCLFFVLLKLREEWGIPFVAVHVNHGLRGEAARADEEFTVRLCKEHDVKCVVFHVDVETRAREKKESVEEAGRNVRREAFEKTLAKEHGTKIAMAHHQNDNAETFLMNLVRGSGLNGLAGIRPVNGNVIRPLLCLTRKEIEELVQKFGCGWCIDATNDEDEYTRNRLRNKIMPLLEEQVNVKAVEHINEAAEQIRIAMEYMESQAEAFSDSYIKETADQGLQMEDALFEMCPEAVLTLVLKNALTKVAGARKDISAVHVNSVLELAKKQNGRTLDLPYEMRARKNYGGILLEKKKEKNEPPKSIGKRLLLQIPGETLWKEENLVICSRIFEKEEDFSLLRIPQTPYTKWFDYDIISGSLGVRYRQPGDRITIDKSGKSQKLKSYFINEKIPVEERGRIPIIADEEKVFWIVGYRMNTACQITEKTRHILEIKLLEDE